MAGHPRFISRDVLEILGEEERRVRYRPYKIGWDGAEMVRRLYWDFDISVKKIADQFGVTDATIYNIINYRTYSYA